MKGSNLSTKVGFVSLGCPKNEVDCEMMLARVAAAGYEIVPEDSDADVMIVNTCAFIRSAKEEGIENVLDLAWLKKNRRLKAILLTGCMAQRYMDEIRESLPEVDGALSMGEEHRICEAIEKVLRGEKCFWKNEPEKQVTEGDRALMHEGFAYLRISDGCDHYCSFCAIPSIRGRYRSRRMEDILKEAKTLSDMGIRELILVAQDTTRYGEDLYGRLALAELLEKLAAPELGFIWIRVLYAYPETVTDELIEVMARHENICKYLDIPIQHVSDPVLAAMRRRGGRKTVEECVSRLREAMPGIVLRTTVLVGFPGEKEKDVDELCRFIKEGHFQRLSAFAYSREEGTKAYELPGQIPEKTKQKRLDAVMQAQFGVAQAYNESLVGKKMKVLCEAYDPILERFVGRTEGHAPEIDGAVYFTSPKKRACGEFVTVLIEDVMEYDLLGKEVDDE